MSPFPIRVQAVVHLPRPLHFAGAVLGNVFPIQLGARTGTFSLPTLTAKGNDQDLVPLGPPSGLDVAETIEWGRVFSASGNWSVISTVVMHIDFESLSDDLTERREAEHDLRQEIRKWFESLYAWLAAITEEPSYSWSGKDPDSFARSPVHLQWLSESGEPLADSRSPLAVNVGVTRDLTLAQWECALKQVSTSTPLPLEHGLLNDARVSLRSGDYRRCVIDAATVCEVCMSRLVDQALRPHTALLSKHLLSRVEGMKRLSELAAALDVPVPEKLQQRVIQPRNKAAHKGVMPTDLQAFEAVWVAQDMARLAMPLPL